MTGPGWPSERGWLVILSAAIFIYVLTLVAFVPRLDQSQLFTALASGVVGAVFRDVIGMWTASTKAGSELAGKAMDALHAKPIKAEVTNDSDNPIPTTEARP